MEEDSETALHSGANSVSSPALTRRAAGTRKNWQKEEELVWGQAIPGFGSVCMHVASYKSGFKW